MKDFMFVNKQNALYESLKRYPIVDLAPVYDKGVRGRTMSGRGSNWLLAKVRDAGIKVIIDLVDTWYTVDKVHHFSFTIKTHDLVAYRLVIFFVIIKHA